MEASHLARVVKRFLHSEAHLCELFLDAKVAVVAEECLATLFGHVVELVTKYVFLDVIPQKLLALTGVSTKPNVSEVDAP